MPQPVKDKNYPRKHKSLNHLGLRERCKSRRPISSRLAGLGMVMVVLSGGLTACAERTDDMEPNADSSPVSVLETNRTSREVFDDFRAAADAAVQASATPEAWTTEDDSPWAVLRERPILAGPCPSVEYHDGPWQLKHLLLNPATDDPQGERDRMRRHFEGRGMTVVSAFDPQPHEPPHATWAVTAQGKDGSVIEFSANSTGQGLLVYSECSSHPSMQDEVSPITP